MVSFRWQRALQGLLHPRGVCNNRVPKKLQLANPYSELWYFRLICIIIQLSSWFVLWCLILSENLFGNKKNWFFSKSHPLWLGETEISPHQHITLAGLGFLQTSHHSFNTRAVNCKETETQREGDKARDGEKMREEKAASGFLCQVRSHLWYNITKIWNHMGLVKQGRKGSFKDHF